MKLNIRLVIFLSAILLVLAVRFVWLFLQSDASLPQRIIEEQLWQQGFQLEYATFEVNLSIIPSVEITQASLVRHDVENASVLAEVGRLYIDFELLPFLLRGKFSLDELEVEDANIYIARDASGANNWFPQKKGDGQAKKPRFQLKASKLKNVNIFYSGPTFVNQKLKIDEAEISYNKNDTLIVEQASGKYQADRFEIEGQVDSLIAFLSGLGTTLNIKLSLPEKNVGLALEGELDSRSLPGMLGLRITAKGDDMSSLLSYFPKLPELKSDEFRFDGEIKSKGQDYDVTFDEFFFRCQTNSLNFSGELTRSSDELGYDVKASGKGYELSVLKNCVSVLASNDFFNLLNEQLDIDFFQFEGEVSGNNEQIALSNMLIDVKSQLDIISLELNTSDVASLSKLSAKALLSGKNVQELAKRISYWYQPDFFIPETDRYRAQFSFFLDKDWKGVEVYKADIELTKGEQLIKLLQDDQAIATLGSWVFHLDAKGGDLAHWYPAYEEFLIPEMLAFDFNGQVFLNEGVWGFRESDFQLSNNENRVQIKGEFSFEQEVKEFNLDFSLAGRESDFLLLVLQDADNSSAYAPLVDTRLSGKLSGDKKSFRVKELSYDGKRGELEGDIDFELGETKKIDAQLGNVHWKVKLDQDENQNKENKKPSWKEESISLDWMDNLDVRLAYEHFKLSLNEAEFNLGASELFMKDGQINWQSISLSYMETEVLGSLLIDARKDSYQLMLDAKKIDFGSLLKELGWFDDLQAMGYLRFSLGSTGNNLDVLFTNMKGVGKFYLTDGKVKNFGNTSTSYIRASMPWRKNMNDLEMDCFMSRLFIENGKLRTRKLYLSNRNMYLMGGGSIDLSSYKLDMAFAPRAHSASFFDANISLFVEGDITNPQIKVGKLSAVSDVGLKYGQWALLGPLALAIPKLPINRPPTCQQALDALLVE